jgi:hypothetical protein
MYVLMNGVVNPPNTPQSLMNSDVPACISLYMDRSFFGPPEIKQWKGGNW